jgi:hypothetical protein
MDLMQLEQLFWTTARGRLDARAVNAAFRSDAALSAVQRMAIYRDMYFMRQVAALTDTFPVVSARLGQARFEALARRYLLEHPSRSPALEWVGSRFAGFLRDRSADEVCEPEELFDIAQLEWLACAAQLAPHEPEPGPPALAPDRWPAARVRLSSSLGVVRVSATAYASFGGEAASSVDPRDVAFFRAGYRVRHLALAADEAEALALAAQGHTLSAVCAALLELDRAHEVLRGWFARRWVLGLEVD